MTSHNYLFKNDISDPDNNVYGWLDFYDKQVDNVVDNSGLTYEDLILKFIGLGLLPKNYLSLK